MLGHQDESAQDYALPCKAQLNAHDNHLDTVILHEIKSPSIYVSFMSAIHFPLPLMI